MFPMRTECISERFDLHLLKSVPLWPVYGGTINSHAASLPAELTGRTGGPVGRFFCVGHNPGLIEHEQDTVTPALRRCTQGAGREATDTRSDDDKIRGGEHRLVGKCGDLNGAPGFAAV